MQTDTSQLILTRSRKNINVGESSKIQILCHGHDLNLLQLKFTAMKTHRCVLRLQMCKYIMLFYEYLDFT